MILFDVIGDLFCSVFFENDKLYHKFHQSLVFQGYVFVVIFSLLLHVPLGSTNFRF